MVGDVAEKEDLREGFIRDILLLRSAGLRPIIVHGGGLEVARRMDEHGTPLKLMNGIPTPSGDAAQVLEETLVGRVNKDLVSLVQRLGGQAVGLSGKDGDLIRAKRATLSGGSTAGTIERVDAGVVGVLDNANYLPIVAAIGVDNDGETVTLSADSVASELAISLNAGKLIFMANTPGITEEGTLMTSLDADSAAELLKTGALEDGTSRRLSAGLRAHSNHVRSVHFIDGRVPHSIVGELFTSLGVGTMLS
jgi:acetylglutamate kinase